MNLDAPPAMPLYVNDWRTGEGVMLMDWESRGVFIHLLCIAWDRKPACTLPNDPVLLKKLCGDISQAQWKRAWTQIRHEFEEISGENLLRNEKQWRVYCEIIDRRSKKSLAGKRGASSRWEDSNANGTANGGANGTAINLPLANACPSIEDEDVDEKDSALSLLSLEEKKQAFYERWSRYPARRVDKTGSWNHFRKSVQSPDDLKDFDRAYGNYLAGLSSPEYAKEAHRFFRDWRKYLDADPPPVRGGAVPNEPDYSAADVLAAQIDFVTQDMARAEEILGRECSGPDDAEFASLFSERMGYELRQVYEIQEKVS